MKLWVLAIALWPALALAEGDSTPPEPPKLAAGIVPPVAVGRSHLCMTRYPPAALRAHATGAITTSFTIATDGTVKDLAVTKSSGNIALDSVAIKCVSGWLYKPASKDGHPIEVPGSAVVEFKLESMLLPPKRLDATACPHDSGSKLPESGTEVAFTVGSDGNVKNISISKSSGDPALDQIGISCVSKWQFSPATLDGQPVDVKGTTVFDWKEPSGPG
jgi:TonB family protein